MIDIAIWAIAVPLGGIVYIVWHGLKITRAQQKGTMAALSSLGDTRRRGYVAPTLAVQRLEKRVKELEQGGGDSDMSAPHRRRRTAADNSRALSGRRGQAENSIALKVSRPGDASPERVAASLAKRLAAVVALRG
jgi:hypothetical protein